MGGGGRRISPCSHLCGQVKGWSSAPISALITDETRAFRGNAQVTALCSRLGETRGPERSCPAWKSACTSPGDGSSHRATEKAPVPKGRPAAGKHPPRTEGLECRTVGVRAPALSRVQAWLPPLGSALSQQCHVAGRREGLGKALQGQQVSGNEPPPVAASGPTS